MTTRDLINAIAAGDAIEIENAFNSAMAEKVSARIDDMRVEVAQNLFAEQVEELEEEFELNLEEFTIEEIQEFVMSEDFEQLDELSKNTLSSYVDKANKDIPGKMADERRTRKTLVKLRMKHKHQLGNKVLDKANKISKKINNREKGVHRANKNISYTLDK